MSVNQVNLLGRLGADPETRSTATGQRVGTLSVATNSKWTDNAGTKHEATEWHRVVLWGRLAELAERFLTKGREVYVQGRIQTRQWQDRDGQKRYTTEIIANNLQLIGEKPDEADAAAAEGMGAPTNEPDSTDMGVSGEVAARLKEF